MVLICRAVIAWAAPADSNVLQGGYIELGVKRMKLLGSPRRMPSMAGYGLEVTSFQPADR